MKTFYFYTAALALVAGMLVVMAVARPAMAQGNNNLQLSCDSLRFRVGQNSAASAAGAEGRAQMSTVICFTRLNDTTLQYVSDAMDNRRFTDVKLTWDKTGASPFDATMTNAVISNVEVSEQEGAAEEEITFSFEKVDFQFEGGRTHLSLNSRIP